MESTVSYNQYSILESILHGVILTDIRGRIVFWNHTNEKLFGYTSDEIMGRHVRILYGDHESISFKHILAETLRDNQIHGQWYGRKKDGARVWLDVKARLLKNDAGEAEICIITICNIGKLKHTQRILRNNQNLAHAIFDSITDAIVTVSEDGTILSTNRAVKVMFGYEDGELTGQSVDKLLPYPFKDTNSSIIENMLGQGERIIVGIGSECQGLKKDGTVFPIKLTFNEIKLDNATIFAGIISDLTGKMNMERRFFEIANEERRKIGRELHDGLGQTLTGIRLVSENLARKLQANELPGTEEVKEIAGMVKEADEYARTLTRGLVQVDLEKKGLSVALNDLCAHFTKISGVDCSFVENGDVAIEDHSMALHLYKIVQEAITNAVKHAGPEKIVVRLSGNSHHTSVVISDDGKGFEYNDEKQHGLGIEIMKHRAGMLGGILEIVSAGQNQTHVRCIIPNNLEEFK